MNPIGNHQIIGDREQQEDYFASYIQGDVQVAVVADGMGGHVGGNHASELALKAFVKTLKTADSKQDIPGDLHAALDVATQRLAETQSNHPEMIGMGTTLVALLIKGRRAWWISVGDSLLYRQRGRQLRHLNANHSQGEELLRLVTRGEMTHQDALDDPDFHALSSALTGEPPPLIDCPPQGVEIQKGDLFLLASDGIETLNEKEISQVLEKNPQPQKAAAQLIQRVENKGASEQDNCTVVTLGVGKNSRGWLVALTMILIIGAALYGVHHFYPQILGRWIDGPKITASGQAETDTIKVEEPTSSDSMQQEGVQFAQPPAAVGSSPQAAKEAPQIDEPNQQEPQQSVKQGKTGGHRQSSEETEATQVPVKTQQTRNLATQQQQDGSGKIEAPKPPAMPLPAIKPPPASTSPSTKTNTPGAGVTPSTNSNEREKP